MARGKSRRVRRDDATAEIAEAYQKLGEIVTDIQKLTGEQVQAMLEEAASLLESGKANIEELRDEIAEWRDNLDGANMSHLPKYEEVSEAADQLDAAVSALDSIEIPILAANVKAEDLDSLLSEIEDAINEAESVDFPGMF